MVALGGILCISLLVGISTAQQKQSEKPQANTVTEPSVRPSNSIGAEDFGLGFLRRISHLSKKDNSNFIISPLSIWSLLYLLYEGADGSTYHQMRQALRINVDDEQLRSVNRLWSSHLNVSSSNIEIASLLAVYTDKNTQINSNYRDVVKGYQVQQVDFFSSDSVMRINEDIKKNTRGLISDAVHEQNIYGAKMFLLSSLYFKGLWKFPFDESLTHMDSFFNEDGEVIGQVPMMTHTGNFAIATKIEGLDGYVLELPYGEKDSHSMIIILPRPGIKLYKITKNLKTIGLSPIMEKLKNANSNMAEIVIPKFTTTTNIDLKTVLMSMGIRDLFNEHQANLSRMARDLFVKTCVHSTTIIVDENGTAAAALSAATLSNKAAPPKFMINKPFQYLIVEKSSNLLLFAGQVQNPLKS